MHGQQNIKTCCHVLCEARAEAEERAEHRAFRTTYHNQMTALECMKLLFDILQKQSVMKKAVD